VAEVIDPQEAEESSIIIVKPTKFIYGNTSLRIEIISQTKKAPTQLQKPSAMTLEFAQKSRESPNKVEIPLLK
jgi:ribonucleotide monophosphatase NagD (HAD superfamily)